MPRELETKLVRAFVAAARAGSIGRAAADLEQTQPALSQQLRRLEDVVGRPLLYRSAAGVTPTPTGEAFLPYAERILALCSQALSDTRRLPSGRCGIGLLEDLAASHLPQALADLARLHPGAVLEALSLSGAEMREAYDAGRVQLVLNEVSDLPEPPRWTVRRPLVWAAAPELDLSTDPLPVVLFSDPCPWRTAVVDTLERAGRRWTVAFESNSLAGVLAAMRSGLGAAALLPANVPPTSAWRNPAAPDALPALPDLELGLTRHPRTNGEPLVDAVEAVLRRIV